MVRDDAAGIERELGHGATLAPRPRVAEDRRWQQVQRVGVRAGVSHADADRRVGRVVLRVGHVHDPVAILVEDTSVDQLELRILASPGTVDRDELVVGERRLRIVVVGAQPGVRRRGVVVPPVLLGVLAVIALPAVEAEEAILQVAVAAIPHREGEGEVLVQVAEAEDAVLAPAEGPRPGLVVGQVAPRIPIVGVVLADGPPGPLRQVRAPEVPGPGLLRSESVVTAVSHAVALSSHPPILPCPGVAWARNLQDLPGES